MAEIAIISGDVAGFDGAKTDSMPDGVSLAIPPAAAAIWVPALAPHMARLAVQRDALLQRCGLSLKDVRDLGGAYCATFVGALIFLA